MGLLNKSVKDMSKSMGTLSRAFQSIFAASVLGFGIRELVTMSDTMQQLRDRITVVTGSFETSGAVMEQLAQKANGSRTSIEGMAQAFTRFSVATSESGLQVETLMEVTDNLQKTFMIMGSTTAEASAMALQLSQSLAAGRVQGDEFRSMMESNAYYTGLLAQQMGVTRGELKQLSKEGKITAKDALLALANNTELINKNFEELRITAGQGATVAMNNFKMAVNDLNETISLSSNIGKSLIWLSESFKGILAVAITAATYALAAFIVKVDGLTKALGILKMLNPEILALSVALGALVYVITKLDSGTISNFMKYLNMAGASIMETLGNATEAIDKFMGKDISKGNIFKDMQKKLEGNVDEIVLFQSIIEETERQWAILDGKRRKGGAAKDIKDNMKGVKSEAEKTKEMLAALNKQFLKDGDIQKYFDSFDGTKLRMLHKEFSDGKMDLIQYREQLREVEKWGLAKSLRDGTTSLKEYESALNNMAASAAWDKFNSGRISIVQLNKELAAMGGQLSTLDAITVGVKDYVDSLGSYTNAVAAGTTVVMRAMEDEMVDFLVTGEATWEKFTDTVLKQIARIVVQMTVMKPIIDAFMGALYPGMGGGGMATAGAPSGGTGYLGFSGTYAKGGAFDKSGVTAFASGGVVSSPTMFGFGRNKTGLMGEAGPEAIMPLRRTKSGDLGVQATTAPVYVNITNNSGAEVTQTESTGPNGERQIEVMIHNTVNKGLMTGKYDTAMSSQYNTRRRGK